MSHDHKLVCGSLFVLFAATHVGCAGSGLKNMFTRNETDGYHSLEELETDEQSVAETEVSGDEVEKSSMVTRLSSWRPFSKTEPTEEETSAVVDADTSDADSEDAGRSPRFLGRAFAKRESVEPDPFLSVEPKLAAGPESPSFHAVPDAEIAKIDEKSKRVEDEFAIQGSPKPKSAKDAITGSRKDQHQSESTVADTNAVALGASRKVDPTGSKSANEDDALAKRFEQHFLLNSVGTVAQSEKEATAVGNDRRQKVSTRVESKKRELSSLGERQIDQFDFLLAAQQEADETTSEFQRNADAEQLQDSNRSASTAKKSRNSLAAFDQLIGIVGSEASREGAQVTNTATQIPEKKSAALDINVADAEALFGAAAARQSKSLLQPETSFGTESTDRHIARSSAWSQKSENSEEFESENSRHEKPESRSDRNRDHLADAFARHAQINSRSGNEHTHHASFGAPPASAGNVEGAEHSIVKSSSIRLSNASAPSNEHGIVTANYGKVQSHVISDSVATETSALSDARFTAAPVAPGSGQESVSDVGSATTRPGLVQSFSTRNWLLLIGGVIVIALLFAPGRTRRLTMNGRPANG